MSIVSAMAGAGLVLAWWPAMNTPAVGQRAAPVKTQDLGVIRVTRIRQRSRGQRKGLAEEGHLQGKPEGDGLRVRREALVSTTSIITNLRNESSPRPRTVWVCYPSLAS